MSINIIDGFYLGNSVPIDSRFVVNNITDRDAIQYKYDGLKVFVISNRTTYIWNQGTTTWDTESSGSTTGSGTANYLAQWVTNTSLGNSIVYATASTGRVGINDNSPRTTLSLKDIVPGSSPLSLNIRNSGLVDSAVVGYNWYYNVSDLVSDVAKSSTKIEIGSAGGLQVQTRTAGSAATFNTVLELNNLSGYNFLRGLDKGTFISGSVSFGLGTSPTMSPQLVNVGGSFRTSSSFHSSTQVIFQTTPTYTILSSDHELIFNSSNSFQITLPVVNVTNVGRVLEISNNNQSGSQISFSPSPLGVDNLSFSGVIQGGEKVKLVAVSILGGLSYQWKITEIITPSSSIYSNLASESWKLIGASGTMANGQPIPTFASGVTNFGGLSQNLRLRKINSKYIHLQGTISVSNISSIVPLYGILTLPVGYRPTNQIAYTTILQGPSNYGFKAQIAIGNTGQIFIAGFNGEFSSTPSTYVCYLDLQIPID
jgi:hypothetical protein